MVNKCRIWGLAERTTTTHHEYEHAVGGTRRGATGTKADRRPSQPNESQMTRPANSTRHQLGPEGGWPGQHGNRGKK